MAILAPSLSIPAVWATGQQSPKSATSRQRIGQWTLETTRDPFTGSTSCRLRTGAMSYSRLAMTFQLGRRVDTFDAFYKIDQGPAVSWRVNAMVLAASGVLLQSENLSNSSGGRVAVPLSVLVRAGAIAIRASSQQNARVFSLKDLPAALGRAKAAGCGSEFNLSPGVSDQPRALSDSHD
jgi:hypothetical protein